jgi:hypothetical protein
MHQKTRDKKLRNPKDLLDAQFNRLTLSAHDFSESQEYLGAYSERLSPVVQAALLNSAIVCYARPFTANNPGKTDASTSSLPRGVLKQLNTEQKYLHRKIVTLRNEGVAHSDYDLKPTRRVPRGDSGAMMWSKPFSTLAEGIDIEKFKVLARLLEHECINRFISISQKLGRLENGDSRDIPENAITRLTFKLADIARQRPRHERE